MPNTTNSVNINEIPVSTTDSTLTSWGSALQAQYYFVLANGSSAAEVFDAADISQATAARMVQYKRGAGINMGAGDDTVIGTAFGDSITAGSGVNYVDGGANGGTTPDGRKARDVLNVFVATQNDANNVIISSLSSSSAGADLAAFNQGYTIKVTNGAGETDYLKGVEQINVFNQVDNSYVKTLNLTVDVQEIQADPNAPTKDTNGNLLTNQLHHAWAQGTSLDDSFDASTVSPDTASLMASNGRGVYADMGSGNDTVTGSGYGDDITAGAGTNYVDGGANAGTTPWGSKAQDVLHVRVANQTEANAVQVVQLTGTATGTDQLAFAGGYTHKVVTASGETDYIKGIERVTVEIGNNNQFSWVRDIPLAVVANEANLNDANIANFYHLAWINGTAGDDTIDLSGNSSPLSAGLQSALGQYKRGVFVDAGSGNDTIIGTGYADNFRNGAGNSKIDGGNNDGPAGQNAIDVFEIQVASTTELNAIQVQASDDTNYTWMVTYGTGQKDYLKNIEAVTINVAGTTTGKWIPLTINVNEIKVSSTDNTKDSNGNLLTSQMHYASASGTAFDDSYNASTLSQATKDLMAANGRGMFIDMGEGNDSAIGTAYGDDFAMGSGTNYVDGGANGGSTPWGGKPRDVLHVRVASQTEANAVQVAVLTANATGADGAAQAAGYTHKVTNGAGQTDYVKGIEAVVVEIVNNGQYNWFKEIPLAVMVNEIGLNDPNLASRYHFAFVNGTAGDDTVDLSGSTSLLSSGLQAAMGQYKRGVFVDTGAGNDTIVGTGYADSFRNGAGNSKIDGGANDGPSGQKSIDVFEIVVASTAELNAVQVQASDDTNYTWMVTYGTGQKDYLKNIEAVTVNVSGTATGKWIPLAIDVNEIKLNPQDATRDTSGILLTDRMHYAYVQGTGFSDTFDAASLSQATKDLMSANGRGIYADLGSGDDTITGSAYGDNFISGSGINYVDGGAHGGTRPGGGAARDVLDIFTGTQAQADAVTFTALDASMTGLDGDAFSKGYQFKVQNGTVGTDYVKNIETVNVQVWNDKNANGNRDYGTSVTDPVNEVTLARTVQLVGTDATVSMGSVVAGQNITVTVNDADVNTDGATKQSVTVKVLNAATNEFELVTLSETGNNTGIFSGTLATQNNTVAGTDNNQSLNVGKGNQVSVSYTDAKTASGIPNHLVSAQQTATAGVTGSITMSDVTAGQTVTVTVNDADLNSDAASKQTVTVQVKNTVTNEVETVTLTETGNNTGEFSGTLGSKKDAAGAGNDGTLNVGNGDQVTATYIDALTTNGLANQAVSASKNAVAGSTGSIALGSVTAGQPVSITVTDADLNADAATKQTVNVQVRNTATNEVETVTLTETGNNTGVFAGSLVSNNNATAGSDNSGDMNVTAGQGITASYSDALTAAGTVNQTVTDSKTATAGTTGSISLSNVTAGQALTITVNDLDLNTDSAAAQTVTVQVKNAATNETESVLLTETGNNTGIFSGTLGTTHVAGAGTSNSGNLNVASGNSVVASYTDALTATGAVNQTVTASKSATAGTTGTVAMSSIIAGQTITLTVNDADLNSDQASVQTLSVQVRNTVTNETETVVLTETGSNTGIFSGNLATTNAAQAGTNDSGNLNVSSGNNVTVSYVDALTTTGAVNQTVTASRGVTAGTTGTITLGNVTAGQPVTVTVNDADVNTDAASAQSLNVQVKNNATNEVETVTLTETGSNTGVFTGTLATAAANAAGASDSGSLNVAGGNTLVATYSDALTAAGAINQAATDSKVVSTTNTAPTFASPAGVAFYDSGFDLTAMGGVVQADGKSLALLSLVNSPSSAAGAYQFLLGRTNADGTTDTTFGNSGSVVLFNGAGVGVAGPAMQSNGKVLVALATGSTATAEIKVLRFNADGSADTTFGTNGEAVLGFGPGRDTPIRIIVQSDDKIVVAGQASNGTNNDFGLLRFNADGSADTGFGNAGKLVVNLSAGNDNINSIVAQADGKLLVTGRSVDSNNVNDVSIIRVNTDGTLDTTFNASGKLILPVGAGADTAAAVLVQADGKIVLVGSSRSSSDAASDNDQFVLRLNANGELDSGFGNGGKVIIHATANDDSFSRLAQQADGKLVVLGAVNARQANGFGAELVVTRFNTDGTLDTGFGVNGSVKLPGRGIIDQASSLRILNDGKILIQGNVSNDLTFDNAALGARLNPDGSLDATFNPAPVSSINGTVLVDGVHAKALDINASIYDAELSAAGSYGGSTLTLARQGGANAQDVFVAIGDVSFANGNITIDGIVVGTAVNTGGALTLSFNQAATQGMVNRALHGIAYANNGGTAPATVTIGWTFSDGNTNGGQGLGGAMSATGTTTVQIGTVVSQVRSLPGDITRAYDTGAPLSQRSYFVSASGTAAADNFDASTNSLITNDTRALMQNHGRGAFIDMGAGGDTVQGTAYGDLINAGSGVNFVDGGANGGSTTNGTKPMDVLEVTVATQAEADAVTVTLLDGTGTQADVAAFQTGYKVKVVNGGEIDYVRNVEAVDIKIWQDKNGNGSREYTGDASNEVVFVRRVPLAVQVNEIKQHATDLTKDVNGNLLSSNYHFAFANGSLQGESFDAASDVSQATMQLMNQYQRGVSAKMGAGDDTVTGSAYGDRFNLGSGTNRADGGTNLGTEPSGFKAQDILEIIVTSQAQANAVTATLLASGVSAADDAAIAAQYTHKVVNGADVNYVKNMEAVHIMMWNDANNNGQEDFNETTFVRSISLVLQIDEIKLHATDPTKDAGGNLLSSDFHFAWVNGTDSNETFTAATDLSSATLNLMAQNGRGMFIEMGGGNDSATGTGYGDNFVAGPGVNYLDGGANAGSPPWGGTATDTLDVYVGSQAEADAVQIVELTGSMTGSDKSAFEGGYLYKVVTTVGTDYVKNIEQVNVQIWNDKDGDGQRDYAANTDPANEVTFARGQQLSQKINAAPTFAAPANIGIYDAGVDFFPTSRSVVLPDGKIMVLAYFYPFDNAPAQGLLIRFNPDGTGDTTFSPNASVSIPGGAAGFTNLALQADGKFVYASGTNNPGPTTPDSDFKVYRINADGTPDLSFGTNGSVTVAVTTGTTLNTAYDAPRRIAVQQDGKIVVAGTAQNVDFGVIRLNTDGSLDTTFGNAGKLIVDVGTGTRDFISDMVLQADDSIILVGNSRIGASTGTFPDTTSNTDYSVVRITKDGALDSTFSGDGKLMIPIGAGIDRAYATTVLNDGKILVAGESVLTAVDSGESDASLVRLNADGTLDTTFGNNAGKALLHLSGKVDKIYRMTEQADGKILVAGITNADYAGYRSQAFIERLNADGSVDTSFGNNGITTLPLRGIYEQVSDVIVINGKIQFIGATAYDYFNIESSIVMARLNMDGSFDSSFFPTPRTSLGNGTTPLKTDGVHPLLLDRNVSIFDPELAAANNYGGATLNIARQGGANAEDVFVGYGGVSYVNGRIVVTYVDGIGEKTTDIGAVTQSGGVLTLGFNNAATQDLVNMAVHSIGYTNANGTTGTLTLNWTFSDGNTGPQGTGGAKVATGTSLVQVGMIVNEVQRSASDASKATDGSPLSTKYHLANVSGTAASETFTVNTTALMNELQRGAFVDMGSGNDTVTGTAYGDNFIIGKGTSRIDGGANAGVDINNNPAVDTLEVNVTSQAAVNAVQIIELNAAMGGSDGSAYAGGYRIKVVNGDQIAYVKNFESIDIKVWDDFNNNGRRDFGQETEVTQAKHVSTVVNVFEVKQSATDVSKDTNGNLLASSFSLASANGTQFDDVYDAASLSQAAKTLMTQYGRGMNFNMNEGNDTVTGTSFGDRFNMGSGTNYADGGANTGTDPNGNRAADILEIIVSSPAQGNAVTATRLLANSGNAADDAAFAQNYQFKVVNGADVNYVKNMEAVHVMQWIDSNNNGVRDGQETTFLKSIPLALEINEIKVSGTDITKDSGGNPLANDFHFAWANGTAGDESFTASTDLSPATLSLMAQYGRGMFVDMGGGNDSATGTGYGDNFVASAGVNYIDGGANAGTQPGGGSAMDILEVYVANQTEADAVQIITLDGNQSAADNTAFGNGYFFKVVTVKGADYVKNIEQVSIQIWNDKDGDQQRDYSNDATVNEVSYVRGQALNQAVNKAPTFATPAGVAIYDSGVDFVPNAGVVQADGKVVLLSFFEGAVNGPYQLVITRFNADGTPDTTFNGTSQSAIAYNSVFYGATNLLQLADGKFLFAVGTSEDASSDFKVIRLNANGSLDTTFGTSGSRIIQVSGAMDTPNRIALTSDNKIVVAGTSGGNDFAVARLNFDGSIDTTFNTTGKLVVDVGTNSVELLRNMVLQGDDKIVMVGQSKTGVTGSGASAATSTDYAMVRVNVDGSLDTGFGSGGKLSLPVGAGIDVASSAVVLPDGRIVVAGNSRSGNLDNTDPDFSLVRLNADGTLDTSFGTGGKVVIHATPMGDRIYQVTMQTDGKLLIAGTSGTYGTGFDGEAFVGRLNENGTIDNTFGTNGFTKLPLRGVYEQTAELTVANGKIVLIGATAYETSFIGSSAVVARLNMDGSFDTTFAPARPSSLGNGTTPLKTDGVHALLLDRNVSIYDADLWAAHNYGGATLTLARQGGANAEDVFVGFGEVSLANNAVTVNGMRVGAVAQSGGQLTLTFDNNAQQGMVNRAIHGIAYTNAAGTPGEVTINWTFSDGNAGAQGTGGAKTATGSSLVLVGMNISEVVQSTADATKASDGSLLASKYFLANVSGTAAGETFNAETTPLISAANHTLMTQLQRGAFLDMGPGNDNVTGTAYGDNFIVGSGTNYVDGGANTGNDPNGFAARDVLEVYVGSQAEADAIQYITLNAGMGGADAAAYATGYRFKIVNGNETDYLQNIENIDVKQWLDMNNNGRRDFGNGTNDPANEVTMLRHVSTSVNVNEIQVNAGDSTLDAGGNPLANSFHMAWVDGTQFGDSFDAASLSQPTKNLMQQYQRGMFIAMNGGDDTVVGTAYGDNIDGGSGVNRIDGGDNQGTAPWGAPAADTLEVWVSSQQQADAVQFITLGGGLAGADLAAANAGYVAKIVSGADVNYIKNIENIDVKLWTDKDHDGFRDYGSSESDPNNEVVTVIHTGMGPEVSVVQVNAQDSSKDVYGNSLADLFHLAFMNGSKFDDVFDAANLPAGTLSMMSQYQHGMYLNGGSGNDTLKGTAYGDNFEAGSGVNFIDGGANGGTMPGGSSPAQDVLEIFVSSAAAANPANVVRLNGSGTPADVSALNSGYVFKVVSGNETDYLKDVETVMFKVWTDIDGDGQRDYQPVNDPANEVVVVGTVDLTNFPL
jgi:uncharacterized delta-60 repeat protein